MSTSFHWKRSMNEYRQKEVLPKTESHNSKVQARTSFCVKRDDDQITSTKKSSEDRVLPRTPHLNNRKPSKKPYANVCIFKDTDSDTMSTKMSYKISISFGLTASCMHFIKCSFHNGAGPNLLREDITELD